MKIIPLNRKVIVKIQAEGDMIEGIIIPESAREASYQATVVVSDFDKVAPGDFILYSKYSGAEFKVDETRYIILDDVDILCKIEKD